MRLEDYLDTLDIDLEVRRYSNQGNRWCAQFNGCEVKEGDFLKGEYGNGQSPTEAISEYVRSLRGKRIVFNAYGEKRREYTVPMQLADKLDGDNDGPR